MLSGCRQWGRGGAAQGALRAQAAWRGWPPPRLAASRVRTPRCRLRCPPQRPPADCARCAVPPLPRDMCGAVFKRAAGGLRAAAPFIANAATRAALCVSRGAWWQRHGAACGDSEWVCGGASPRRRSDGGSCRAARQRGRAAACGQLWRGEGGGGSAQPAAAPRVEPESACPGAAPHDCAACGPLVASAPRATPTAPHRAAPS